MLIISGVARGMKNREIAIEIGTTEQVVKNYLREVYDKLGIADRLELALYCVQHHLLENLAHSQNNVVDVQQMPSQKLKAAGAAAGARSVLPQYLMAKRDETE